jgi:hypothetical protein
MWLALSVVWLTRSLVCLMPCLVCLVLSLVCPMPCLVCLTPNRQTATVAPRPQSHQALRDQLFGRWPTEPLRTFPR